MRAFVVVGLGYGDEGKGSIVDWLTRDQDASLVVRFNGGAQAAHHVVTDDNREHTFSQFGSGTFAGADTYLSEYVLVNPLLLAIEAATLMDKGITDPFARISVHERAAITTPFHVALNRLKEMSRGDSRHGSCGLGIGETMIDVLDGDPMLWCDLHTSVDRWQTWLNRIRRDKLRQAFDLPQPDPLPDGWEEEMHVLMGRDFDAIAETIEIVALSVRMVDQLPDAKTVVFEGAQGVLIDETYGKAPYHTWSTCTPPNALAILADTTLDRLKVLGLTRAYMTRHGAGPFPSETTEPFVKPDRTNGHNRWQEQLRYGYVDLPMLRYAVDACHNQLNGLVVTCMDQLQWEHIPCRLDAVDDPWDARQTVWSARPRESMPKLLSETAQLPLYATSWGDTASAKRLEK